MWMHYLARGLALIWAGWWTFFGVASGLGEGLSPVGVLLHAAVPGLVFLASTAVAWCWPVPGAWLLLLEGLMVLVGYPLTLGRHSPPATVLIMLATMALPPLVAGLLLLIGGPKVRVA